MGLLKKFENAADKLASAGAGNRMPAETRAQATNQSNNTNARNQTAEVAVNLGASRAARKAAKSQLVAEVGEREAERLMKQANKRVRTGF